MKRILLVVLALLSMAHIISPVRHIDGLGDITWKQKGSIPIQLVVYDATFSPEWAPLIEDAASLWDDAPPFTVAYVKLPDTNFPQHVGAIHVGEYEYRRDPPLENLTPLDTYTEPDAHGVIEGATIWLPTADSYAESTRADEMRHWIRHTLGHALTVTHHVDPTPDGDQCAMAIGDRVTAYDFALLCQRFACR